MGDSTGVTGKIRALGCPPMSQKLPEASRKNSALSLLLRAEGAHTRH